MHGYNGAFLSLSLVWVFGAHCARLKGETGRSLEEQVEEHGKSIERQDSKLALSKLQEQS